MQLKKGSSNKATAVIFSLLVIFALQCIVWKIPAYADDLQAPTAPGNLRYIKIGSLAIFYWNEAKDNEGIAGYEIYRNGAKVASTTRNYYLLSGLSSRKGYAVYIKAFDTAGNYSEPSSTLIINEQYYQDTAAPAAPCNLRSAEITGASITLVWDTAIDNMGVTGYEVYQGNTLLGKTAETTYVVTGLTPETAYSFTVKAYDGAGNISAASEPYVVATLERDKQAPTPPRNLQVINLGVLALISWDDSTDNTEVAGYEIYRNGEKIATTTRNYYLMSGISARTAYVVYLKAYDEEGNISEPSDSTILNERYYQDTEAPTAPLNLRSTQITGTSVTIAWDAATDNMGVVGYEVYQDNVLIGKETGTTYTVTGLETWREYSFTVKAFDAVGNQSVASNEVKVTPSIEAPSLFGAATTVDGTKIIVEFNKEMAAPPAAPAGFAVLVNGVNNPVQTMEQGANIAIFELTLEKTIYQDATSIQLSYTAGTVTSADGGRLANFSEQNVVNNSTAQIILTENRYFYDEMNRLKYIQLSTGQKIYYEYDENGNLLGTKMVD